jgi:catechol 2,3-dioxygenase-like lactoylglutathione lyase family enzyme
MIIVDHLDHLVLTVASVERSCVFYATVLGMEVETFGRRNCRGQSVLSGSAGW